MKARNASSCRSCPLPARSIFRARMRSILVADRFNDLCRGFLRPIDGETRARLNAEAERHADALLELGDDVLEEKGAGYPFYCAETGPATPTAFR